VTRLLDVEDVSVCFGGVQALDGVSMQVDAGEIVGLMGPNGAGKTTLLNAISGLVRTAGGSVALDGRDLRGVPAHLRARLGLARTLQGVDLFTGLRVRETLLLASRLSIKQPRPGQLTVTAVGERARAAAEFVGVTAELDRDTEDLPGGRQRLVDIATALCLRPRCLLLDEPAAGSGRAESGQLGKLILRIREALGVGILLVEHDVQLVLDVADYVYVLDFGRVIAEGTPAEVRVHPAVVAAYLGQEIEDEVDHPDEAGVPAIVELRGARR
jgi:ABC-type branched-subunit amino acid transport system ATPase component